MGLLKVRLYRPFSNKHLVAALPPSAKVVTVLDRTKEPGSAGDPLYLDVVNALMETGRNVKVLAGRYGLSSKEFTPAMVKAIFDNSAAASPKNHFTVGINDDVANSSLAYDASFSTEPDDVVRAMFYGLGSDGTVGANKNSIKIIGEETDNYAQGYFVYDSKKAGAMTVSHLRFGPRPIRSQYLINRVNFLACHTFTFLEKFDILETAIPGATFLLNVPFDTKETWGRLPQCVQEQIIAKKLKVYAINGYEVAKATNMGGRVNTIMQTCFFYLSNILPQQEAVDAIKKAIKKTYGRKGEEIVKQNYYAVDQSIANLHEVKPAGADSGIEMPPTVFARAPEFVKKVTAAIMAGKGDALPVSAMPIDGTWPTATTQWEKRNIALEIPIWDETVCIQCGKCSIACPHATIRAKVYEPATLAKAPAAFKSCDAKGSEFAGKKWTIQVAPEDCTGCGVCVNVCPAKNKTDPARKAINMEFQPPLRERERANYEFFLSIPDPDRATLKVGTVKGSQSAARCSNTPARAPAAARRRT